MTNIELLDLLREAREQLQQNLDPLGLADDNQLAVNGFRTAELLIRIDAALAEVNPCRLIDVGDDGVSRKRVEADAFQRGVAAMRKVAVEIVTDDYYHLELLECPVPEDKS